MIRNIDENNDWLFGHGKQDYAIEEKEIEIDILTSIKCWKNNCFFDLGYGIDWYNILGSRNTQEQLKSQLSKLLNNINGVVRINNIDYTLNEQRKINININLDTIYKNNIIINEVIQ